MKIKGLEAGAPRVSEIAIIISKLIARYRVLYKIDIEFYHVFFSCFGNNWQNFKMRKQSLDRARCGSTYKRAFRSINVSVVFFFCPRCTVAKRIMFQFALHSHATENATVVYLTGFRAEALEGRRVTRCAVPAMPPSRARVYVCENAWSIDLSTISASTGRRADSDPQLLKIKNKKKKEKRGKKKDTRCGVSLRHRARREIASTTAKKGTRVRRAVFQEENIAAR